MAEMCEGVGDGPEVLGGKTERKEVNRVRNGVGEGWHARQAHAEQNIGLIEKSTPSFMPYTISFSSSTHRICTVCPVD